MKKPQYGNILITTSLQYDNHFRQYFVDRSRKVVALYILPRKGGKNNFFELYKNKKIVKRKSLYTPNNIVLWYIVLYLNYIYLLFKYFSTSERIFFINWVPALLFFNSIIKIFRKLNPVFLIGDFWPMKDVKIRLYRSVVFFYNKKLEYVIYQTDRINKAVNGKLVFTVNKKTIIPSVIPPRILKKRKNNNKNKITLCFIGVIVPWQGIDLLLKVVKENQFIHLKLIGTGEPTLIKKYKQLVEDYGLENRVYFPNKFIYGEELYREIKDSDIGIALYEESKNVVTYYADPAKIKQYIEFGLPIIMTNSAEVADLIRKYEIGIIVKRNELEIDGAIKKIRNNYNRYLKNLEHFGKVFNYETFYRDKFAYMEEKQ